MNMQSFANLKLRYTAMLTFMFVTGASAACLTLPVWSIIWVKSTAPSWIVFTIPVSRFPFAKTATIAKVMLVPLNLVGFALELRAAIVTLNSNKMRRAKNSFCTLPGTTTFSRTKVVIVDCARRFAE